MEQIIAAFNSVKEKIPPNWRRPVGHFIVVFLFLLVGTLFYHAYEGWAPGTCLAFAIVTISTVGYGYQYPTDDASRAFTIFFMLFGIFFVFGGIADIINSSLQEIRERNAKTKAPLDSDEAYVQLKWRMLYTGLGVVGLLFFGAFMFMALEGWTFIKAFYFAVETSTTVGYGDLQLNHGYSNVFLVFYIVFSTILLAYGFNNLQNLKDEQEKLRKAHEFTRKKQTLSKIKDLDKGNGVPQDTFVLAVLEHLGVIDHDKDVEPWIKKFKEIDADGSGAIDAEEIEMFCDREAAAAASQLERLTGSSNITASRGDAGDGDDDSIQAGAESRGSAKNPLRASLLAAQYDSGGGAAAADDDPDRSSATNTSLDKVL